MQFLPVIFILLCGSPEDRNLLDKVAKKQFLPSYFKKAPQKKEGIHTIYLGILFIIFFWGIYKKKRGRGLFTAVAHNNMKYTE